MTSDAWRQALVADLDNGREALASARAADDATMQAQIATTLIRVLSSAAHREQLSLANLLDPLIERIDRADLLARIAWRCAAVVGRTDKQRVAAMVQRCLARIPPVQPSTGDVERFARYLASCALASAAALAADLDTAEAALGEARALEDAAWPAHRRYWRVQSEGFVVWARARPVEHLQLMWEVARLEAAMGESEGTARGNISDAQLGRGDAAAAVASGTALVAELVGGRNEHTLALARENLAAAHLALDQTAPARLHLQAGWSQAPLFDMQHSFADYLALLAAIEGRHAAAARLSGYADAANASVGLRSPNERAAIDRATRLARVALGDAPFERLHAEGALLGDADIAALAFAPADDAPRHTNAPLRPEPARGPDRPA